MTYRHKGVVDHVLDVSKECPYPHVLHLVDKVHSYPLEMIIPCNKRFACQCPACSKRWRSRNYFQLRQALSQFHTPKFLTLTLKYDRPSRHCERVKLLWQYRRELFRQLRASRLLPEGSDVRPGYKLRKSGRVWRPGYKIKAWIAIVELPNHIHIVFDGSFIPQDEIQSIWREITSDSWFVNIKQVRADSAVKQLSSYLSKYMSKMADYPPEMVSDLRSFHMIQTHGVTRTKSSFLVDYKGIYGIGSRGWELISRDRFWSERIKWNNKKLDRYLDLWFQRDLLGHRLIVRLNCLN
jgi:hypothetical protein